MCVICYSPKGHRQPTDKEFSLMWAKNPHGAGYAYLDNNNNLIVKKGFMTFDDFKKSVSAENIPADVPAVYHFRISTGGGVIPELTHPFKVGKNTVLFHNGIIRDITPAKLHSDTEIFSGILRKMDLNFDGLTAWVDLENDGHNKFILFSPDGIEKVGQWFLHDGLYFSNMFWENYTPDCKNANYKGDCKNINYLSWCKK